MLGLYGAKDASIPQDTVETMRQALRAANATAEIVVYPEADHAFNADYRASYHEESAKDGWQRMLAGLLSMAVKRVIALSMKRRQMPPFDFRVTMADWRRFRAACTIFASAARVSGQPRVSGRSPG